MHQGSRVNITLCTTYDSGSLQKTSQMVGPCRGDGRKAALRQRLAATQSMEWSKLLPAAYIKRPLQTPLQDLACSD